MDEAYVSKLLHVILYLNLGVNIAGIKILHYMHQTQYFCGVFCEGTFLSHHILLLFDVQVFKPFLIFFPFESNLNSLYFIQFFLVYT
jgi:hypothetical protein